MNDKVVGKLWAHNYSLLGNDPNTAVKCRAIGKIVEIRAKSRIAEESWSENIRRALQEFGIPRQQWDEFNQSILARSLDSSRRQYKNGIFVEKRLV